MWKRSLFFAAVGVSFFLGLYGAGSLRAAGPWFTSCQNQGLVGCPVWQCAYTTTGGVNNATCSTCGWAGTTCKPGKCGQCLGSPLLCCAQWSQCAGENLDAGNAGCQCGVSNLADVDYCQRKPSIWTLFASW